MRVILLCGSTVRPLSRLFVRVVHEGYSLPKCGSVQTGETNTTIAPTRNKQTLLLLLLKQKIQLLLSKQQIQDAWGLLQKTRIPHPAGHPLKKQSLCLTAD